MSPQTGRGQRDIDLSKSEQRQHATGLTFFGPIGLVARDVARSAGAGIMDLFHASGAKLIDDLCGKIDFVMWRPNAGAQLDNEVGRIRPKSFAHLLNRFCSNCQLRTILPGMHQADRGRLWIDNVNGTAISDVNAERDPFLIRDNSITVRKLLVAIDGAIDYRYLVAVNLLCSKQRPISNPNLAAILAMDGLQSFERFGLVVRNINPGNSLDECVTNFLDRI